MSILRLQAQPPYGRERCLRRSVAAAGVKGAPLDGLITRGDGLARGRATKGARRTLALWDLALSMSGWEAISHWTGGRRCFTFLDPRAASARFFGFRRAQEGRWWCRISQQQSTVAMGGIRKSTSPDIAPRPRLTPCASQRPPTEERRGSARVSSERRPRRGRRMQNTPRRMSPGRAVCRKAEASGVVLTRDQKKQRISEFPTTSRIRSRFSQRWQSRSDWWVPRFPSRRNALTKCTGGRAQASCKGRTKGCQRCTGHYQGGRR